MRQLPALAAMGVCKHCNEPKPASEFRSHPAAARQQGYSKCVACRNKDSTARRMRNPLVKLYHGAKNNARTKGQEFTIVKADVSIPAVCPVLGIPIRVTADRMGPNSPSIDRLDSSLGYVPGNVNVISWRANRIKSDATLAELKLMVAWLEREATQ